MQEKVGGKVIGGRRNGGLEANGREKGKGQKEKRAEGGGVDVGVENIQN